MATEAGEPFMMALGGLLALGWFRVVEARWFDCFLGVCIGPDDSEAGFSPWWWRSRVLEKVIIVDFVLLFQNVL